jgi:serine/threonine-protein kinase
MTPLPSAASGHLAITRVPVKKSPFSGPLPWIAGAVGVVGVVAVLALALTGGGSSGANASASAAGVSAGRAPTPPVPPAPSAAMRASAAPSAAPSAVGAAPGEAEARSLRDALNAGPAKAATTLLDLLKNKPDSLREPTVQAAAAAAADKVADAELPEADEIFQALAQNHGEPGLDVLYELTGLGEGSKAAARANALLARPEVIGKGSIAMRVAYDLRRASCQQRTFLFPRAAKEGDDRSLVLLNSMIPPACEPRVSPCCFLKHGELEKAVADIRTRLRR